ncbi:hypothetical protein D1AOALGA4SA_7405 [Olavius algarvensis Delta 1 endosymbiont]|nr:hypothetical protein D1AOALGA4SA_7405 [Olavius algarvensis Delta 1 endosymbiont]
MKYFSKVVKPISTVLAVVLLLVSISSQPASAAMIGTEKLLQAEPHQSPRDYLHQLLARQEIKNALVIRGIDPLEAELRIQSLTDEEIRLITARIDELAAGGGVEIFSLIIIGVIIATVLLFKFTNITNVFP